VRVHLDRDGQPTHESVAQFGNLYAAMPSFHVGWSTWSVLAIWPLVRRRWARLLLLLYPLSILFCITVTANHWLLDAVGGWAVFVVGYAGARLIESALDARRRARTRQLSPAGTGGPSAA
jgi:hypothetical protein